MGDGSNVFTFCKSMVQLKKLFCWMLLGTNDLIEEGVTMVLHNNYIHLKNIYYIIYIVVSMLYFVSSWIQSHFRIDFLQVQRLLHKQDLPVA